MDWMGPSDGLLLEWRTHQWAFLEWLIHQCTSPEVESPPVRVYLYIYLCIYAQWRTQQWVTHGVADPPVRLP